MAVNTSLQALHTFAFVSLQTASPSQACTNSPASTTASGGPSSLKPPRPPPRPPPPRPPNDRPPLPRNDITRTEQKGSSLTFFILGIVVRRSARPRLYVLLTASICCSHLSTHTGNSQLRRCDSKKRSRHEALSMKCCRVAHLKIECCLPRHAGYSELGIMSNESIEDAARVTTRHYASRYSRRKISHACCISFTVPKRLNSDKKFLQQIALVSG
jgi:hypothetical protein